MDEQMAKDAARYRWLRDLQCNSFTLGHDDAHACNYVAAKEWIEECAPEMYADVPPDELERMKAANTIWSLQVYPDTPVGFNWWHAATMDAVIDAAMATTPNPASARSPETSPG